MTIHFDSTRTPQLERYDIEFGDLEADLLDDRSPSIDAIGKKYPRRGNKRKPTIRTGEAGPVILAQTVDTGPRVPNDVERELKMELLHELGEAVLAEQVLIEDDQHESV